MKNISEKIASRIGLFAFLAYGFLLLLTLFIPELSTDVYGSGLSLAMAGTIVTGVSTADSRPAARVVPDISSTLTRISPDLHPLNIMLRKLNNAKPAHDREIGWEEKSPLNRRLTVNGATTIGDAGASKAITVDANASHYIKGDLLMVQAPSGADASGWAGKRMYVVSGTGTTLTVRALDSTGFISQVPIVPDDSVLIRYGNAKSEKEGPAPARGVQPVTVKNYVQTFEKVISISRLSEKIKTFTGNDYKEQLKDAMTDFIEDMEYTHFFGIGSKTWNPENNDWQTTMHGAHHYVTTNVFAPTTLSGLTETDLLDYVRSMVLDDHSSNTKILFADPFLMGQLAKMNFVADQLKNTRKETVLGTKVTRIMTPFNVEILFVLHKGFHKMGKKGFGFILDPMNVRRRELEKMYKLDLDIEKSGGERVKAKKLVETCSVEFRNEISHGWIQAINL